MAKHTNTRTSPARRRAVTAGGNVYGYGPDEPERNVNDLNVVSRIFWACHKNRVELAPPVVAALLWGTSAAVRVAEVPAVGLLAGVALGGFTYWAAPKRWDREEEALFARLVTGLASLWLIAACLVGPVNPVVFWALIIGTAAGAVPWYRHKLVRPKESNELLVQWAERWDEIRDRLGLGGSVVIAVKGDADYAEITLQLVKGVQTYADVAPLAERIAGALGLPASAIKVRDRRKVDASTATLIFTRVSVIDGLISWAEAAKRAPKAIAKPFVLGRRESGDWKTVNGRGHWMIVGTTRAGKSNQIHGLMANITGAYDEHDPESRADALVFFVDLKGGSVGGRWADVVDWFAADLDEAVKVFESANGMIDARALDAPVGEGDGDQLEASPECPAIYIVFDECAEGLGVTPGSPNQAIKTRITGLAESIARRGAAMNVYLVLSGQDGSLETYGTEKLRGNLTRRMCFRVGKSSNAQYVMDNYTGLDVTGLEDGQFYYHERADDPVPIRGPWMTPEDNRKLPQELARKNAARRPVLDEATAAGGGEAYATRHDRLPAKYRNRDRAVATVTPQRKDTEMAPQHDQNSAQARAAAIEAEVMSAPAVTADDLRRASEAEGFDLAQDLQDTTDTFCALLANAPVTGVQAKHLYGTVGVGKTWMYDRLGALEVKELVVQPSRGFWRAAPGVRARDLREAIDAWDAQRRQLVPA